MTMRRLFLAFVFALLGAVSAPAQTIVSVNTKPLPTGCTTGQATTYSTVTGSWSCSAALYLAGGTATTSTPLVTGTQTWNAAGVAFKGATWAFTETASAAGARYFEILGGAGGVTDEFYVGKGGIAVANEFRSMGPVSSGNDGSGTPYLSGTVYVAWKNGSLLRGDTSGTLRVANNAATNYVEMKVDAASTGRVIQWGTGTPEGAVTASIGSLYLDIAGGASTTLYVKTSGTGNTGWTAK